MKVAIASGKGGTGKTTLAVNLACAMSKTLDVTLLDCDVEAPDCLLFLKSDSCSLVDARVPAYKFNSKLCTTCRKCAEVCRFNAIAVLPSGVMYFPELGHGCGGCMLSCLEGAITEISRVTGKISTGSYQDIKLVSGSLNVGETMAPPLIRQLKACYDGNGLCIIDSPPGTSCSMLAAVSGCDVVILVTEPTPFGLHDLKLAVAALREMKMPFGVVVNRDGSGDDRVNEYCKTEGIELIAAIADSREVAELYSRGEVVYRRNNAFTSGIDTVARWLEKGFEK